MAIRTITDFKSQLRGGGARPNLFRVDLGAFGGPTTDTDLGWDADGAQRDFNFLCKATSMPTQTIGSVDVPFRGRILKVAGDRTFEPWSVTVINDESFNVRSAFEAWGRKINDLTTGAGVVEPQSYMGSGTIQQLSRSPENPQDSKVLQEYIVQDIWPSEIGSIDLSYESSDAIEEFTVTFQVQYMEILGASTATNI
jgi:hypothetical protein